MHLGSLETLGDQYLLGDLLSLEKFIIDKKLKPHQSNIKRKYDVLYYVIITILIFHATVVLTYKH